MLLNSILHMINTIMKMMVQSDQKIMWLVSSVCDSEFHGDTLLNHPTDVTRTFCNINYVWFWIAWIWSLEHFGKITNQYTMSDFESPLWDFFFENIMKRYMIWLILNHLGGKIWKDNESMYDEWFWITLMASPEDFGKSFKPGGSSNSTRILGNHLDIFYT